MYFTGYVRRFDDVGRIVVPKDLRRTYSLLDEDAAVEIFTDNNYLVLKKYAPICAFCGSTDSVIDYKGVKVCAECAESISKLAK